MTTIVVTAGVVNEEEEEEIRIPWAVIALSCESQDHFKGTINRGREFEASTKKIKHAYRYKKRNARNPAGLACATIKPSLPFLCFRERKLVSLTARSRSPPSRSHRQPNNPPPLPFFLIFPLFEILPLELKDMMWRFYHVPTQQPRIVIMGHLPVSKFISGFSEPVVFRQICRKTRFDTEPKFGYLQILNPIPGHGKEHVAFRTLKER